jgi:hypothetical protein
MDVRRADICGVTKLSDSGTEYICLLKPHRRLFLVKSGDTARSLKTGFIPHNFEIRYPYRINEET